MIDNIRSLLSLNHQMAQKNLSIGMLKFSVNFILQTRLLSIKPYYFSSILQSVF